MRVFIAVIFVCIPMIWALTCRDEPIKDYPFCNKTLDSSLRAKDIVSRMTLDQKVSQLDNVAAEISELGIEGYNYGTECLHGVLIDGATSFPAPVSLGATYNKSGWHEMAIHISTEARAFSNRGGGQHLTCWAPNINIQRDPRWGRNQETPGEDPFMSSQYVEAYVTGIQEGNDPRCVKAVSTCKHFLGYSLEKCCGGTTRFNFDANLTPEDLAETYLPAFEACVRNGARSIMCSYNSVNGIPACADADTMQGLLRDEWGFDGFVVSDCGAISQMVSGHHWVMDDTIAVANSMRAGCDLNCGSDYGKYTKDAIDRSLLNSSSVDVAIERAFTQRFDLGMWDTPDDCSYQSISPDAVDLEASRQLAEQLARESIVLLKNDDALLPLKASGTIAVIGPHANNSAALLSNYHAAPPFEPATPLVAIQDVPGVNVRYVEGCKTTGSEAQIGSAVAAVKESDVTLLFLGLDPSLVEAEGLDRDDLLLPGRQLDLLEAVTGVGKPVVVVLIHGGPIGEEKLYKLPNAVLDAFYPGELGGNAIRDVIFGYYNPGGKLPHTIYPNDYINMIDMRNMDMSSFPGRTYKYLQIYPIFEFGFGLSYTTFNTTWTESPGVMKATVTNTGAVAGDEVVLAFKHGDPRGKIIKKLVGFERVHLKPGQQVEVEFHVSDFS